MVKAQVLAGGRGKGGAVRFANTIAEAEAATKAILGLEFKGETVREVLLEEKLPIGARALRVPHARPRSATPARDGERPGRRRGRVGRRIGDRRGSSSTRSRDSWATRSGNSSRRSGVTGAVAKSVDKLLDQLWEIFQKEDAELVEINPLAVVGDHVVALDAKVIIEDDASFRHPEYSDVRDDRTPLEEIAREKEIAFVQLDGNIGVIANGAGLTMATLDVLPSSAADPGSSSTSGGPTTRRRSRRRSSSWPRRSRRPCS